MSNTDWYVAIEADEPWKAFNDYAKEVSKAISFSIGGQATEPQVEPKPRLTLANLPDLDSVAVEAQRLWEALPPSHREPRNRKHCYGLPRAYPKLWMARASSNSLMFEFHELQGLPSNRLKDWKD